MAYRSGSKRVSNVRRGAAGVLAFLAGLAGLVGSGTPAKAALKADELLLVVNGNSKDSVALAEFYAKARLVPDGRICKLDLPAGEEIPFEVYERHVVPTIKHFLQQYKLQDKVRCLVTFYGTPIRIAAIKPTPAVNQEVAEVRTELNAVERRMVTEVGSYEQFVREQVPEFRPVLTPVREVDGFTAAGGSGASAALEASLEQLTRRTEIAGRALVTVLNSADPAKRAELLGRVRQMYTVLSGDVGLVERFEKMALTEQGGTGGAEGEGKAEAVRKEWEDREKKVADAKQTVESALEQRYDPTERARLRQVVKDHYGLLAYARILRGQLDYLDSDQSHAAFDSELTLLWHDWYPRAKWLGNPLYWASSGYAGKPVLMTARIDGPDEAAPRLLILGSFKAERDGLSGRVVIDSRGLKINATQPTANAYADYDQTLRNLNTLLRSKTNLQVTFDERDAVLPPHSVKNVALYCGWYSVGNYVPCCTFVPGAVGFHVASFEMVTLKDDKNNGWVKGLLKDGVCATTGPVAEPYLFAFPDADEFFPLMLTGKLTLAECYFMTQKTLSWQMSLVGDPLYRPWAKKPPLAVTDLPFKLIPAVQAVLSRETSGASSPVQTPSTQGLPVQDGPTPKPRGGANR
jgi:uncharacterized protein (TIGR03790 family)